MRGFRLRACRTVLGTGLSLTIVGWTQPREAWALDYPGDNDWVTLTRDAAPIVDGSGDSPGPRDIVGDAQHPMAYVQSNSTHLYFRLRINEKILSSATNIRPYGWGCVIDTNGDPSNYEYSAIVDGVSNPDAIWIWKNSIQEMPNSPTDTADPIPIFSYEGPFDDRKPGYGYARERDAGTVFPLSNPDPDVFVDWAIERSKLAPAVGPLTPLRFACGTAADGTKLSQDFSGPEHLPDLFSDPVLCDNSGCYAQTCPEFGNACTTGIGGCAGNGTFVCLATGPVCNAVAGRSSPEICNGIDDDCNGEVDDGNPGSGLACTSTLPGICAAGTTTCADGAILCISNASPQSETCNGLDDDCNGIPDDGAAGGGVPCITEFVGICAEGYTGCNGGQNECVAVIRPGTKTEICNGLDDDCNGSTDEAFAVGTSCAVGIGACAASGQIACDGAGAASCNAVEGAPATEVCGDLVDSDCDGNLDNNCPDTDGDGIPDHIEIEVGTDPNDADSDDDGVRDGSEIDWDQDSDGDGTLNVLDPDSDDDGLFDGTEMGLDCGNIGTDPAAGHCIADADEGQTTTNPLDSDTDDGTLPDGAEDLNANGVIDPGEKDPLDPKDDVELPPECIVDLDCASGNVCIEGTCTQGCRGDDPASCPVGQTCSSVGEEPGQCITMGIIVEGGGCACQTGSSRSISLGIAWVLAIAGALALRRNKK